MSDYKDLTQMLEILTTIIEIHAKEEDFCRRSANTGASDVAKALFNEIADELGEHRASLEARRRKVQHALNSLQGISSAGIAEHGVVSKRTRKLRDPVCNMLIDKTTAKYTSMYGGKKYYFCSADCKKAFDLAPSRYVKGQKT